MRWLPPLIAAFGIFAAVACGNSDASQKHGALALMRLQVANPTPDDVAYNAGVDDFFADSNAHGGVGGYTFNLIDVPLGDDPSQYAATITAAKSAYHGTILSVFSVDNVDTNAARSALEPNLTIITRADDPMLCAPNGASETVTLPLGQSAPDGTNPAIVNAPQVENVFHVGLDAGTGARLAMQQIEEMGGHRVSFAVCATPARGCANGVLAGKDYATEIGLALGADLVLPSTADAVPGLVTAYLDSHPLRSEDWIWVGDNPAVAAALTKTLKIYSATHTSFLKVRVMVDSRAFGEPFRDACGADCAGVAFGLMPLPPFGDARPFLMTEVSEVYSEMHPGDPSLQTTRYVEGFANAVNWANGIDGLAVPNLPVLVPTVRNSVEVGTPQQLGGLVINKTFSTSDHRALSASEVYGIDGNGLLAYAASIEIDLTPETLGY